MKMFSADLPDDDAVAFSICGTIRRNFAGLIVGGIVHQAACQNIRKYYSETIMQIFQKISYANLIKRWSCKW